MATTETPLTITMNAGILSGERLGEIADIVVGEPNGAFINNCKNPPDFMPEKVEAVFTGFPFQGKKTMLTLAFDGSVIDATDPELDSEEKEAWDGLMEASRQAEVSARALRDSTDNLSETLRELRESRETNRG